MQMFFTNILIIDKNICGVYRLHSEYSLLGEYCPPIIFSKYSTVPLDTVLSLFTSLVLFPLDSATRLWCEVV